MRVCKVDIGAKCKSFQWPELEQFEQLNKEMLD